MALTDKLTAIGDAIREKNGTTKLIPLADMPQAIRNISGGETETGIEPLDNTVTFTVDGEPYEIVSVKNGNSINEPVTQPTKDGEYLNGWKTSEGNVISFPYAPTSDTNLEAVFDEFIVCEYIESTGTQYIDTGYLPNNKTRIECEIMITNTSGTKRAIFGTRNSDVRNNFYLGAYYSTFYYGIGATDMGSISYTTALPTNTKQTVSFSKKGCKIGNWSVGETNNEVSSSVSLFIFAKNIAEDNIWLNTGMRLYDFKIYEDDVLIHHFIPVCVNEPCLYDTVTKAYFYNLGTGEFITN